MTTVQAKKIARRKLSLLQLAQELGNVSKACRIVGYIRQQFYEIRRNFQVHGADGLLDRMPGAKGPHPNRVPAPVEKAILAHALEHPTYGVQRLADELMMKGDPGQFGRGAGRLDPQRPLDPSPPAAPAGGDSPEAAHQAHRGADPGARSGSTPNSASATSKSMPQENLSPWTPSSQAR